MSSRYCLFILGKSAISKIKVHCRSNSKRYNENTVTRIRKLEKPEYRLRKAHLDLEFLCKCANKNVVPKFLNFNVANNHLKYSSAYKQSQSNLLREEKRQEKSTVKNLQKEFSFLRASLIIWLILPMSVLSFLVLMTRFWNRKVYFSRKNSNLISKLSSNTTTILFVLPERWTLKWADSVTQIILCIPTANFPK